jgi:hypothetical protein
VQRKIVERCLDLRRRPNDDPRRPDCLAGAIRTSAWRNQNPPILLEPSMLILKKLRNPTDSPVNGLVLHSE